MKYSCDTCRLKTNNEGIWNRHLNSAKHKLAMETQKKAPKRGKTDPDNRPLLKPINCPYCKKLFTMSRPLKEHITETCPKKPVYDSPFEKDDKSDVSSVASSTYKNDFLSKQRSSDVDSPLNMDSNQFDGYNSDDENPIFNPEKFAEIEMRLDELIRQFKMNNPRERDIAPKPVYPIEDEMDPYGVYYYRNPRLIKL